MNNLVLFFIKLSELMALIKTDFIKMSNWSMFIFRRVFVKLCMANWLNESPEVSTHASLSLSAIFIPLLSNRAINYTNRGQHDWCLSNVSTSKLKWVFSLTCVCRESFHDNYWGTMIWHREKEDTEMQTNIVNPNISYVLNNDMKLIITPNVIFGSSTWIYM